MTSSHGDIAPANMLCENFASHDNMNIRELFFEVPLSYAQPLSGKALCLFARVVTSREISRSEHASSCAPLLAFLRGGPGAGNVPPQSNPITSLLLGRGYEIVFLDYRGTGQSSPISSATLEMIGSPIDQADYLRQFRPDSIVKDLEAVRKHLTSSYPNEEKRWTIFGFSFGGMVCTSYLSFHPEGVRECLLVAGLHPLDKDPSEVYERMYERISGRNRNYYRKWPEDVFAVRRIVETIQEMGGEDGVSLPGGGSLTVQRFLSLGLQLGVREGANRLHKLVQQVDADVKDTNVISRATLTQIEEMMPWDAIPLYAMHESFMISGPGVVSNWAADRVGRQMEPFAWLNKAWKATRDNEHCNPVYFTGGTVHAFLFDTCPGLKRTRESAQLLAGFDDWPVLYDVAKLRSNEVPVSAVLFDDMFTDQDFGRETASQIQHLKLGIDNNLGHDGLEVQPSRVLDQLFDLATLEATI